MRNGLYLTCYKLTFFLSFHKFMQSDWPNTRLHSLLSHYLLLRFSPLVWFLLSLRSSMLVLRSMDRVDTITRGPIWALACPSHLPGPLHLTVSIMRKFLEMDRFLPVHYRVIKDKILISENKIYHLTTCNTFFHMGRE